VPFVSFVVKNNRTSFVPLCLRVKYSGTKEKDSHAKKTEQKPSLSEVPDN
jgi:hypothetical protein